MRERLRVYAWVGGDSPKDTFGTAMLRVKQGFDAVKLNATGTPYSDLTDTARSAYGRCVF